MARIALTAVSETRPLAGWRRTLQTVGFTGLHLLATCMGVVVRTSGHQADRTDSPILVVAPHSTFFDGLASFFTGMPYVISREENGQIPFIGKCIEFSQAISVNREDPESRHRTVQVHRNISYLIHLISDICYI